MRDLNQRRYDDRPARVRVRLRPVITRERTRRRSWHGDGVTEVLKVVRQHRPGADVIKMVRLHRLRPGCHCDETFTYEEMKAASTQPRAGHENRDSQLGREALATPSTLAQIRWSTR